MVSEGDENHQAAPHFTQALGDGVHFGIVNITDF